MAHRKKKKKTLIQVITSYGGDQYRPYQQVVIFAGEYTARRLREGVIDDGPVTGYTAVTQIPSMLEISLEDGDVVSVCGSEL